MGQIASATIPLSRMISPQLYWVMSDSEFTLDINNPEEPKILCVGVIKPVRFPWHRLQVKGSFLSKPIPVSF